VHLLFSNTLRYSRFSGKRVGKYLPELTPLLINFTKQSSDDELRETVLQTIESAILRCPDEVGKFVESILDVCLELIKYDPNYVDDDDEDGGNDSGEDDDKMDTDEDQEDENDGDYSDDDDLSWKVRRASSKVLSSVIATRSDLLPLFYKKIALPVIGRFKEREEVRPFNLFLKLNVYFF